MLTTPKQILNKVRERQINDSFEHIVDQLFSLRPIGATSEL